MTSELTPAVNRALSASQRWAISLSASEATPLHLLLAILEEDEGRPAELLARQQLSLAAVREKLLGGTMPVSMSGEAESLAYQVNEESGRQGSPPCHLHTRTQDVLSAARWLAADLSGESIVASEHVLAAILQNDEHCRTALESLGFQFDVLESHIRGPAAPPIALDEPLNLAEPAEMIDTARILDANANRTREGLRVLEDYCRFVLDDSFLTEAWKKMRHDLTAALADVSLSLLIQSRDTSHDVGTSLRTPSDEQRHSPRAVALASAKRLQEALRCLEEYGKLQSSSMGRTLEGLRYRSYTLEKAVLIGGDARRRLADVKLYVLVSAASCAASIDWTIREATAGGARMFQLREKKLTDAALIARAREVRQVTRELGVLFILNDRPDIARLVDADGVHLGQDDLSVKDARRILGPDALIGVSTHNLDQLRRAILDGASYVGVGPTFPSATKSFDEYPGLEFVRQAAAETTLPAFAIGGITLQNAEQVVQVGISRLAVGHALGQSDDPRQDAAAYCRIASADIA